MSDGGPTTFDGRANSVELMKVATDGPGDLSAITTLREAGYELRDVLAVVGKTEGNGCVNDFSRTLGSHAWRGVLGDEAITVMSGGTEGVLSPHVTLLIRTREQDASTGLLGAIAVTGAIAKPDLGRRAQVTAVADAVIQAMTDARLATENVHLVLVKCPLLTSDDVTDCVAAGRPPITVDTYESMARSRAASALGVALALGECEDADVQAALDDSRELWSSVASVSSGAELTGCHVVVLGTSSEGGRLRMCHAVMTDALDAAPISAMLKEVENAFGRVVQVFAKAEASPEGHIRGHRHTMLTDSDVHSTRHARAAVGGLIAGLVGDPAIYVSGGAENQGPPGGGPIAFVYEVPAVPRSSNVYSSK